MSRYAGSEREEVERFLRRGRQDFSAVFMAASSLRRMIGADPSRARPETVETVACLLHDRDLARERQALCVFQEAAGVLTALLAADSASLPGRLAMQASRQALRTVSGKANRALTGVLGDLPLTIRGPDPALPESDRPPEVTIRALALAHGGRGGASWTRHGRSLVKGLAGGRELLVVKPAGDGGGSAELLAEIAWMKHLAGDGYRFSRRFAVPRPITVAGSPVFRIRGLPAPAIAFFAPADYFAYPNEPAGAGPPPARRHLEALLRSSWLLGHLAARGVIHTAPIPLFHNRVQVDRRDDHGLYDWQQRGRLDAWLASCRYPNFGLSGLRDFEHFVSFSGHGAPLYRHLGTHLLSLLLVAGSCFRNQAPHRVGLDRHGQPVDARDLFDRELVIELLARIFLEYHEGFVGRSWEGDLPFDVETLADRMIEEMGVDRYLEEILRKADQERMSDAEFRSFLRARGYPPAKIASVAKGAEELVLHTGPHLGGFNQPISLPELIDATGSMAAASILGRFLA